MFRKRVALESADTGAYCSTDAMLRKTLGVSRASEPIAVAMASLPSSQPLAFIANRHENDSILTALTVSYLAWPHSVFITYVEPDEVNTTVNSLRKLSVGAMFFYVLKPPADLNGAKMLGNRLVFVPPSQKP